MVRRLASALQIPTFGIAKDICQLLDAKLLEFGYESMKVQVRIAINSDGVMLSLEYAKGTFLLVTLENEREPDGKHNREGGHEDHQEAEESFEQALETSHTRDKELTDELHAVKEDLDKTKDRVDQLWQVSCEHLTMFDVILVANDREIALLRQVLEERSLSLPPTQVPASPKMSSLQVMHSSKLTTKPSLVLTLHGHLIEQVTNSWE